MQEGKVFAIGFHRTGTTSIARALEILGYRFTGPNFTFEENLPEVVNELALDLARQYDAFSDSPWFLLYKELDEQFPGSKFILTSRPTDKWLKSVRKLTTGTPMERLIYGENIAAASDARLRERYERHNREVLDYFSDRPDDLLVIDFSAKVDWPQLCPFLDRAAPDVPFPYLNRSPRQRFPGRVGQKLFSRVSSHYLLATRSIPPPFQQAVSDSSRNILLLSMSAGAGCVRAADAVAEALRELAPTWHVKNIDVLNLPGATSLRKSIDEAYRRIEREPWLWDWMNGVRYKGQSWRAAGHYWGQRIRHRWNSLDREFRLKPILPAIIEVFRERRWDAVISTSPMFSNRVSSIKVGGALSVPLFVINTDFSVLRRDCLPRCDHFFASCEDSAADMEAFGWLPHKMTVTGIPVMPEFARPQDRQLCRQRFGLGNDKPVVVLLSGGFGMESTAETILSLMRTETPLQILVCAGRNRDLRQQLESTPVPARHDVQVLGWTDGISELLAVADLVLSKPGGLTSAEILAVGAAMAIINPMADHERQNRSYLMNAGAAHNIEHVQLIPQRIERLLAQPEKLAELRSNARKLARPEAAFDIARYVLEWFGEGTVPGRGSAGNGRLRAPGD